MRDSLPRWTIGPADRDTRLDKFLADRSGLGSRARVAEAIARGKVFLNDAEVDRAGGAVRLREGDVVCLWMDRPGSARRRAAPVELAGLRILFEDDLVVVVDKPAGLLTVPLPDRGAASVHDHLREHLRRWRRQPFVVHRIDRDTSGLVLFAKTVQAQQALKDQFRRREPERVYLAVVYGHPSPAAGTWRDVLVWDDALLIQKQTHPADPRGSEAVCAYRVVESFARASLVEVRLHTGKRNQIRIQARLRGHTLVGERRYVYGPEAIRPIEFPRQALHAHRLVFAHPEDGRTQAFESPPPDDFTTLVRRLRAER